MRSPRFSTIRVWRASLVGVLVAASLLLYPSPASAATSDRVYFNNGEIACDIYMGQLYRDGSRVKVTVGTYCGSTVYPYQDVLVPKMEINLDMWYNEYEGPWKASCHSGVVDYKTARMTVTCFAPNPNGDKEDFRATSTAWFTFAGFRQKTDTVSRVCDEGAGSPKCPWS